MDFVHQITDDYKHGRLAAHRLASVHLLSTYKESQQYAKGIEFWKWLSKQDEEYLDARAYGAAIELFAYSGEANLQQLEELYEHALEIYAGTFAAYHLSPNAVLPDRTQPIAIEGMPMTLLQGIMTGRLLLGDWENAYMALDTALRLHPSDLPARFFEIFCYERPLEETYKLFHIACRSLTVLHPKLLTTLLNRILDHNPSNSLTANRLQKNLTVLDQVLDTVEAYVGAGGKLTKEHVSLMVKALANLVIFVPTEHTVDSEIIELYKEHNATIAKLAEGLVERLVPQLDSSVSSAYHGLITLAGKARNPDLILRAFSRIEELGDSHEVVSHRSLITALGLCGSFEAVRIAWEPIAMRDETPSWSDWIVLAKAAGNLKDPRAIDFVQAELVRFAVEPRMAATLRLACKERHWMTTISDDLKTLQFGEVRDRIVRALTKSLPALQSGSGAKRNFYDKPINIDYRPAADFGLSTEELRIIHDEMTTDLEQPQPSEGIPAAVDEVGYPLAEHRFQNWRAINELLVVAEAHAREKDRAVEEAIASRRSIQDLQKQRKMDGHASSEPGEEEAKAESELSEASVQEAQLQPESRETDSTVDSETRISVARKEIRRLRGLDKDREQISRLDESHQDG